MHAGLRIAAASWVDQRKPILGGKLKSCLPISDNETPVLQSAGVMPTLKTEPRTQGADGQMRRGGKGRNLLHKAGLYSARLIRENRVLSPLPFHQYD